jgi:hypothetical protein
MGIVFSPQRSNFDGSHFAIGEAQKAMPFSKGEFRD